MTEAEYIERAVYSALKEIAPTFTRPSTPWLSRKATAKYIGLPYDKFKDQEAQLRAVGLPQPGFNGKYYIPLLDRFNEQMAGLKPASRDNDDFDVKELAKNL
jgi:hypothetical protein